MESQQIVPKMQVIFHPSGSVISGYKLDSGRRPLQLRGHLATINACCWSARRRVLITGSNDRSLLVWAPGGGEGDVLVAGDPGSDASGDAWSGDEETALDALGVGARVTRGVHADDAVLPFSGGRRVQPRAAVAGGSGAVARGAHDGGAHGLGVASGGVRGGRGRGRRRAGAAPSARIQRIAARLIAALHPHVPAESQREA